MPLRIGKPHPFYDFRVRFNYTLDKHLQPVPSALYSHCLSPRRRKERLPLSATSLPRITRDFALPVACRGEGSIAMPLNPPPYNALLALPPSCHFPFSHFHFLPSLSPFRINTYEPPVSVANKELTGSLSPLDSTLTKNRGVGVLWLTRNPIRKGGGGSSQDCRIANIYLSP